MSEGKMWFCGISGTLVFICLVTALGMWGCPQYNVWERSLAGEAQLKEAEWNKQIKIREAKAAKESAEYLKEAEIIRAEGAAAAIKIIGTGLQKNDAYLRYLWIQGLQDGSSEIIYIPTEANIPILEAGKKVFK